MIVIAALAIFAVGVAVGVVAATRATPRLVARLPREERLAFARKVNRLARR